MLRDNIKIFILSAVGYIWFGASITFIIKQKLVHLINFGAEMPPLRQAQKR